MPKNLPGRLTLVNKLVSNDWEFCANNFNIQKNKNITIVSVHKTGSTKYRQISVSYPRDLMSSSVM